jgi:predicted dehydrogenase
MAALDGDPSGKLDRPTSGDEHVHGPTTTRRSFLQRSVGLLQALPIGSALSRSLLACPAVGAGILGANERLDIAGIGVGGKGESDIGLCSSENVVALCDVDGPHAKASFERFPRARRFTDYRRMLDAKDLKIDAVTVSTPDHHHATASALAMKLGKHVYCQKPLAHSIAETRSLRKLAEETKVVTQMGNQGHARASFRRLVEIIRSGALGRVREAHTWTNRPIWPQGIERPTERPAIPAELEWDLWIGPAPFRPYHPAYAPFRWRGFVDFGTGALGDMGCHIIDLPFWGLSLDAPTSIEAESDRPGPLTGDTYPLASTVRYEFPERDGRPPLRLVWQDGGRKPSIELMRRAGVEKLSDNGIIIVGENDSIYVARTESRAIFLSGARVDDFSAVPQSIPRRKDGDEEAKLDLEHRLEWIEACKGGPRPLSSFDYACPLTETVLLGNAALRAGRRITWDAREAKLGGVENGDALLGRTYRDGY